VCIAHGIAGGFDEHVDARHILWTCTAARCVDWVLVHVAEAVLDFKSDSKGSAR
jgi:hypothetical protein